MKRTFLALGLLAVTGLAYSADLALYDAEGDHIGTLVDFRTYTGGTGSQPWPSPLPTVLTSDGYLMTVNTRDGKVEIREHVYFTTADCQGQAYFTIQQDNPAWLNIVSGWIFRTGGGADNHVRVPHGSEGIPAGTLFAIEEGDVKCWVRGQSCGGPAQNCPNPTQYPLYWPATFIDDAQYGLGDIGGANFGFLPPMEFRPQQSAGIFCDGFESCPQQ